MNNKLPKGYRLADTVDAEVYHADDYQPVTVGDLISILRENYDKESLVWILGDAPEDDDEDWPANPIEFIGGSEGHVFL